MSYSERDDQDDGNPNGAIVWLFRLVLVVGGAFAFAACLAGMGA